MQLTLGEFRALSLQGRQKIFVTWLKGKPKDKSYLYFDVDNCPMAQFGYELLRERVVADDRGILTWRTKEYIQIFNQRKQARALMLNNTFGAATQALSFLT